MIHFVCNVYNEEKNIDEFCASLEKQTSQQYKLHIRDDGSTDKTIKKLKNWQQKIPIKIKKAKHLWLTQARKRLIESVEGTYICIIDADMVADEKYVEELNRTIKEKKANFFWGTVLCYWEKKIHKAFNCIIRFGLKNRIINKEKMTVRRISWGSFWFKKTIVESIWWFKKGYLWEDIEMSQKAQKNNYNLYLSPKAIIYHKYWNKISRFTKREYIYGKKAINTRKRRKSAFVKLSTLLIFFFPLHQIAFFCLIHKTNSREKNTTKLFATYLIRKMSLSRSIWVLIWFFNKEKK